MPDASASPITEVPVHWKHVAGSTVHPLHDSITMLADVYRVAARAWLGRPAGPDRWSVRSPDPAAGIPGSLAGPGARRSWPTSSTAHPCRWSPDGEVVTVAPAPWSTRPTSAALAALRSALRPSPRCPDGR